MESHKDGCPARPNQLDDQGLTGQFSAHPNTDDGAIREWTETSISIQEMESPTYEVETPLGNLLQLSVLSRRQQVGEGTSQSKSLCLTVSITKETAMLHVREVHGAWPSSMAMLSAHVDIIVVGKSEEYE